MTRREFIQLAIAAGATVTAARAMFAKAMAATPKKGGSFRVALGHGSSTDTLDPALYLDNYMATVGMTLGNNLAQLDTEGNVQPDLAESFEPSDRAQTWAFKLRKGVTFHNGKDVTTNDVVASVRHHMGEGSKSAVKSVLSQIAEIKADGGSVVFSLKAGNADFPYILSEHRIPIMPATDGGGVDWQSGVRTGPYMLVDFTPGVSMRAKRNPNYHWDTWFDEVEILVVKDSNARITSLLSRDVDFIDRCDLKVLKFLERDPSVEIDQVTGYAHDVFSMNVTVAPYDNQDVRNAIKYAVDREAILAKIFGGIGISGNDNPVAPSVRFATNPAPIHKYDPEMARSLLKKAGLSNLAVNLSVSDAAFTGAVDAAVLFRESAAKAGIDLTVVREPSDGYWDDVWLKKPFVASFWLGRPTVDWTLTFAYAADSTQNETFWKNPQFNELLVAARSELDEAKRAAMYAECQQLLHDDGGLINLLFEKYVTAHSKQVAHGPLLPNYDIDGFKIAQRWWAA